MLGGEISETPPNRKLHITSLRCKKYPFSPFCKMLSFEQCAFELLKKNSQNENSILKNTIKVNLT